MAWTDIAPNKKHQWLTGDLREEFDGFVPLGVEANKGAQQDGIFRNYGRGVATSRDDWAYNFDAAVLTANMRRATEFYNEQLRHWQNRKNKRLTDPDSFVRYDDTKLKWSRDLKQDLVRGNASTFSSDKVRGALYRPFTATHLYFDRLFNEEVYQFHEYFPSTKSENRTIIVGLYGRKHFSALASDRICDLNFFADPGQCFPFYTYDGEDRARRENIPLSTLVRFQNHYGDEAITKWDIFHYVYAVLHHPEYRTRYAANLRRELPRIPLVGAAGGSQASSLTGKTGVAPVTKLIGKVITVSLETQKLIAALPSLAIASGEIPQVQKEVKH